MSALALISGRLHGDPVTRPTRSGGQVTFFKLRVVNGAEVEWWDVAAFSNTARAELEGLNEGDSLSAVGALHVETFEYRGEQRIKRSLTADRVLALKPKPTEQKPRADRPARAEPASRRSGSENAASSWARPHAGGAIDDDLPF